MIKNLILILSIFTLSSLGLAQQKNESFEILLEKLIKLEEEIANLSNSIDQNSYELSRIEEANQLRYIDLDRRIHQLETLILLSEADSEVLEENETRDENPLSGLTDNTETEEEFALWSNSLRLIENSRYSEAAENLRLLIMSYPEGEYVVEAYFYLADIYLLQQMFQDSLETFNSLLINFPENERAPESFYKIGLIFLELEDQVKAISNFNNVIQNYPDSTAAILSEQELVKLNN